MTRFKLTISYDGTAYSGWQIQPNSLTIQQVLQDALSQIYQSPIRTIASGRTDAGVHAQAQVVHFDAPHPLKLNQINGVLPKDIRALHLEEVPATFHAMRSAQSKRYIYYISKTRSPFLEAYSLYQPTFDIEKAKQAAQEFVGTHDFTSFANVCEARKHMDKTRTIYSIDMIDHGSIIEIVFTGNGFLYKMVRNIVGTFLAVCKNKITIDQIPAIFAAKDRRQAPISAKAKGLFLHEVFYDTPGISIEKNEERCTAPIEMASFRPK